jgi:hypothetical protein
MLKDLLLQKGWAGKTISRPETVDRLNPLIRQFIEMNYAYDAAEKGLSDRDTAEQLAAAQKTARSDVGKLAETVFSCGGTAFSGTDLDSADFRSKSRDAGTLQDLLDLEQRFLEALDAESDVEHQMRTRAILAAVRANAEVRISLLQDGLKLAQ